MSDCVNDSLWQSAWWEGDSERLHIIKAMFAMRNVFAFQARDILENAEAYQKCQHSLSLMHRTKLLIQNCNFCNYISKNTSSTHYITEGGEKWDSIFILLVLSFNYTFDHNCETNLSDFHLDHSNRWPISERVVKPIGMHVFNMFSDVGYRDWNAYWGDGERTTFTSKQRGYCWEPPLWAPGTWEISDNRYLWKQVNFSQLQKTEIGAIT